ncbi:MAG: outer membrane lipoprotein chaperone LolA [Gallionellaceae bacterium]|jgi:chaperone LolA|nr:outer membrane lipoprotein chaperone LolA [Gallionellaceae bacterium]
MSSAHADALLSLERFMADTHAVQANFTQTVRDNTGKTVQSAAGVMRFVRPGKFRWEYTKPYEQLIVGDGEKFWLYDTDLNQVTVRKLDDALGSSPAALLAGSNEIERGFALKNVASRDGMDWLEATPKAKDSGFESIRMAFDVRGQLHSMELLDTFENITVLRFSNMQRNPSLPSQLFEFTPPQGADVLEE